jgi:hypothetical protein
MTAGDFWSDFDALDESEKARLRIDLVTYGRAIIKDGKRVDPEDFTLAPPSETPDA